MKVAVNVQAGYATALNNIGWNLIHLDRHTEAITCCEEALAVFRGLADRYGEAAALDSLGYAHQHLGDYASGAARCREALTVFHALGDPYNQASVTPMPASCRKSCGPRWPVRRCGRRTVSG
jgi:tetratricopeptide (TPR) repeat protein